MTKNNLEEMKEEVSKAFDGIFPCRAIHCDNNGTIANHFNYSTFNTIPIYHPIYNSLSNSHILSFNHFL